MGWKEDLETGDLPCYLQLGVSEANQAASCGVGWASAMRNVIIVVPCYNEEKRLDCQAFLRFKDDKHNVRFLFVNDGSTDGTERVLENLAQCRPDIFQVHSLQKNSGKAEAIRQGFLKAFESNPDYVGFWDADLATPLEAIKDFCDLLDQRPELEIVIGSRVQLLGRQIERRAIRHYLGRVFATVASLMLKLTVYDTQCGAKLFRVTEDIRLLFQEPFLARWIFDVEILARLIASRAGKDVPQAQDVIYEFPLLEWRDVKGSKLKYKDFLVAPLELWRIKRRYL